MWGQLIGDWSKFIDENLLLKALSDIDSDLPGICPSQDDVFKAFQSVSPVKTRLVLIGQDPYPQIGIATGLLFANKANTVTLSPSLKIVKECVLHPEKSSYKPSDEFRFDITMQHWVSQGILLLNSSLTVKTGAPGSHFNYWKPFMADFLTRLSREKYDLPYILFGNQAQSLIPYIENAGCILKCSHPAMYARQGTKMQEDPFTLVNEFFRENNLPEIKWLMPDIETEDDLPF